MPDTTLPMPVLRDEDLHFTDNGRVVCGPCAGASARYTGRDISGQEVMVIDASASARFERDVGRAPACEDCARPATH